MRKRSILIALFALAIYSLSACSGEQENDREATYGENDAIETQSKSPENTLQGIRMTREYAIEHGILTEEELEGVDFETMAEQYNLLEGNEEQIGLRDSLLRLKGNFLAPGYGFDYQYLEENEKNDKRIKNDDFDQLKVIAWNYNPGTYYASILIDLSANKAYWGNLINLLERGVKPSMEIDLTDEQIVEIKNLFKDNHVEKWKADYRNLLSWANSDGYWWKMVIELEDGRIYEYSGDDVPNNYDSVTEPLQAYFGDIPY